MTITKNWWPCTLGFSPALNIRFKPRTPTGPQPEAPAYLVSPTGNYPTVVPAVAITPRTDGKYPVDVAVDYLSKAQPLITPEWEAWKAIMRTPKLEGKWMLTGYQQGKGRVFGIVTLEKGTGPDEFITKTEIEYPTTGVKAVSHRKRNRLYRL